MSDINGIEWIRLLYCYPELLDEALLREIFENPKIVNYVDIPLQHVNDEILRKMNRRSDNKSIISLFDKLSELGIDVRSTFICGFPGETKDTVREVESFLYKYKLRNVGFFAYSREEGTAAAKFDNQVSARVKQNYVKKLYSAQYKVAQELNRGDVGKTYKCIVDGLDEKTADRYYVYNGRTYFMTPEIDGTVQIISKRELKVGGFYDVAITGTYEYDLIGEVTE